MATRPATLLPLLTRAPSPAAEPATDRDLLRRFARDRDEAAFAVLVKRHGPMVVGVCRRVLGNPADADDAAQATFLVLARKAGSGRWRPSVASWLYATARQVALNARTARSRRVKHEGRAGSKPPSTPLADISGEELLAILDEELGKLPERYRAPVVLCCIEGLTRDEAAAQLGVPAATLKGQLERGRKRLHDALARRGVALGAGLLVLLATRPTAAASSRLAQAVRAAVTGKAPPEVVALAEAGAATALVKKIVAGLVLAAATAVIGFGLGQPRPTSAGPAPDKEMPAKGAKADGPAVRSKAELKATDAKGPAVAGRVLSPDGKSLDGAELLLVGKGKKAVELGATGTDGKFNVRLPADWKGGYLVARAKGVGIDFAQLGDAGPKGEFELKTVADIPVRGRFVDTEGKPVAGATVHVDRLGTSPGNALGPILEQWKKLDSYAADPAGEKQMWNGGSSLWATTTDKDGRFELRGLGVERLAVLRLGGAGATESQAFVAVRAKFDPTEYNDAVIKNAKSQFGTGKPRWRLYGPEFTVVAEREKLIRGRVFDVDTNKPRAGVQVRLTRNDGGNLLQVAPEATTDKDGRYEIRGAKKATAYMVEVEADTAAGYLQAQARSGDSSGYDPLTIDVRVKKGVVITGRMIDKGTGKGVAGFVMAGIPQGNPSVKDYPEFTSGSHFPMENTDAEGRFRVVTMPGPVLLMGGPGRYEDWPKYAPPAADPKYPQFFKMFGDHTAYSIPGGGFSPLQGRSCKVLEVKAGTATVEQDVELIPAGPAKKPADAKPDPAMPAKPAPPPAKMEKKSAGGDRAETIAVSGRVFGPDGRPAAGAEVVHVPPDGAGTVVGKAAADGAFSVTVPAAAGARRYLVARAPGLGVDWADLGEVRPGHKVSLRLVKDQPITGRVLNTEGKPIAGLTVSAGANYVPADDRLDDYLAGWKKSWRDVVGSPRKRLDAPLDGVTGPVVTAADGTFRLPGTGAERVVHLTLSGKGIAQSTLYVITRPGFNPKPYNEAATDDVPPGFRSRRLAPVLFGPDLTFVAEPGVTVSGLVKDAATGKPVAGCRVSTSFGFGERIDTRTDAAGAYTIAGLPREKTGYSVFALPGKDSGYLTRTAHVTDAGGPGPIKLDVELVKGAVVTGRVIDPKTGKGVVAGIRFAPLPNNTYFASRPGYDNYRTDRTMETTDADGRFRLLTIPGPAVVLAQAQGNDTFHGDYLCPYRRAVPDEADRKRFKYDADDDWTFTTADGIEDLGVENAVKVIDVKADGETTVELLLDRGATAKVSVQDADGKPLPGAWVAGLTEHWPITYRLPDPTATVYALDPKRPRLLTAYHPDKKLGGAVTVCGDEPEPVVLKLGPLGKVTGTLTDTDGKPLGRVEVSIRPVGTGSELERFAGPSGKPVRTDRDGRFTLTGVVPGMPFYLQVREGDEYYRGTPRIGQRVVKPGETLDLGEQKMEPRP